MSSRPAWAAEWYLVFRERTENILILEVGLWVPVSLLCVMCGGDVAYSYMRVNIRILQL